MGRVTSIFATPSSLAIPSLPHHRLSLAEVVKDPHPLHLLHPPVQRPDRDAWPQPPEDLIDKPDLVTRTYACTHLHSCVHA